MLRCRPTPAPRPRLRAPIRWPCWARRGWPRPGWHRRALPDRPADGGGCCGPCCGSGRGRVAGKPCQHHSDRLGLLLRKEAASLTAQQLHLVGEPWRPRSWPSTTAAALAGGGSSGLACRWLGTRIGVGHVRLLARPSTAVGTAGRVPRLGSVAPDPDRVSITPIGASARSPAPTPTSVPSRRRSSAKAARRGGVERAATATPPTPGWTAAGRHGWLGSPSAAGQRMLAATARLPPRWRRSGSLTHRSPTVHAVSGSLAVDHPPLGGAAATAQNDGIPRGHPAGPGVPRLFSHPQMLGREPLVSAEISPRSTASRTYEPGENHPAPALAAAPSRPGAYPAAERPDPGQGRSPSRASSPTSHWRPTRSSARIRLSDQPCAWRALR